METPPFESLGGEAPIRQLAKDFYDYMEREHSALAQLHQLDGSGRISPQARERFALFLIGWTGGPRTYMEQHGHPRLRMRHAHVPIDSEMATAWLDCMTHALDAQKIAGETRELLDARFKHVAHFLRNTPDR